VCNEQQETKLQEQHVKDFTALLPGYDAHWSCSTKKKGYAGSVVFTAKTDSSIAAAAAAAAEATKAAGGKQAKLTTFFAAKPKAAAAAASTASSDAVAVTGGSGLPVMSVRHGIGNDEEHGGEGRAITIEYSKVSHFALYIYFKQCTCISHQHILKRQCCFQCRQHLQAMCLRT
jgi:exonuclease III